jgi:hypothetical protein
LNGGVGVWKDTRIQFTLVPGTKLSEAFSKQALGNLLSKDKARIFTTTTSKQKKGKQSGPSVPLTPFAGVLEVLPPRSRDQLLSSLLPATGSRHGPSIRVGETNHFALERV